MTLMAVVGAYMSAENFKASGFMAVFVFGIMLGNKDIFGFQWSSGRRKSWKILSSPRP